MTVKINDIEIPESQKDFLKEVYEKKYADYINRKENILKEGKEMEPMLIALGIIKKGNTDKPINESQISQELKDLFSTFDFYIDIMGETNYSKNSWSWLQKCKYIIEIAGVPLTSTEIIEILLKYYELDLTKEKLINSIPATLSVATKEEKLERKQRNNGEYEYSLIMKKP